MAMLQSLSSRLPVAGRSLANSVAQAVVARVPCVAVVPSVFRAPPQRFLSSQRVYAKAPGAPARAPPPPPPPPPADDEEDEGEFEGDPLADLNAAARRRVEALREVQKKYDGINVEYQKELALLQAKYLELWAPVFDERRDIVAGTKQVEAFGIEEDGAKDEGVPDFWLNAFYNHPNISPYVNERDADVLRELLDVRASVLTGDRKGFKLSFFFRPNKFFKNTVLEKEYELEMEDEIVPKRFTGTKIEWNPGMDVTVELVKKRVKAPKGAKGAAGAPKAFVTEEVPCDSFFNIFDPPEVPNEENASRLSDEELTELQTELTEDFDIGFALKDQVIARALEWFTGEIAPLEDGEFDEYGDQGYDEQEEEPEAPPPPPPRGGGNKGGRK